MTKDFKKWHDKKDYIHKVQGLEIDIPMIYEDLSSIMFFFPVKFSLAKEYINDEEVHLVRFNKNMTLMAITFSFPVMKQKNKAVPLLPLIFDQKFKNFGFYVIKLGASNYIGRKHINDIWGYPTFDKDLDINFSNNNGLISCHIKDGNNLILSISESFPQVLKAKYKAKKFNTFFRYNNELRGVELNTLLFIKYFIGKRDFCMKIGNHRIAYILKDLEIKNKIATVYYPNAIEMAGRAKII